MNRLMEQGAAASDKKPAGVAQKKAQQTVQAEAAHPHERRHRAVAFQIGIAVLVIAFGILTWLVRKSAYFPVDLSITHAVQSWNPPLIEALWRIVSWAGNAPQAAIVPLLLVLMLFLLGLHWEALASVITAVFVEVSNLILKVVIHRPRPAADLVHVNGMFQSYSFPSGHVMFYTGFFGFMFFLTYVLLKPSWKRTLLLILSGGSVLLVGPSRIYLGAHWASDVLGAYLIGIIELFILIQLYRWGKPRFFVRQPVARNSAQPGQTHA
ncbi:phosphatase PAP2 family protein [Cohnella ginsengisoli]|uniref:Phosphatase PAP2 family protein n=1 Tax=Cohnella ginsengisoli TaxID=425004 RepID=A0A9X4KJ60_9BACL|nr:phosphatase PAP2 family protein [Cohnella ginsengisoli]MDG0792925.1 phosphatase PAP2 family protein [Cohnella ginsengisoli]